MSNKTIKICDRCGKHIEYIGWTGLIKVHWSFRFFVRFLFNGNSDGYSYSDLNIELCAECTDELKKFLYKKEK